MLQNNKVIKQPLPNIFLIKTFSRCSRCALAPLALYKIIAFMLLERTQRLNCTEYVYIIYILKMGYFPWNDLKYLTYLRYCTERKLKNPVSVCESTKVLSMMENHLYSPYHVRVFSSSILQVFLKEYSNKSDISPCEHFTFAFRNPNKCEKCVVSSVRGVACSNKHFFSF